MALGSTQLLTEMTIRNLSVGKGGPARKADNLIALCEPNVQKMWEPRRVTALWAFTACYRGCFTLSLPSHNNCRKIPRARIVTSAK
jgi:hypothetical protein